MKKTSVYIFALIGSFCLLGIAEAAPIPQMLQGVAEVWEPDTHAWRLLHEGERVKTGAKIRAGQTGRVTLGLGSGRSLSLAPHSLLTIEDSRKAHIGKPYAFYGALLRGTVSVHAAPFEVSKYQIDEAALTLLKNYHVPMSILVALEPLENQVFFTEQAFLDAVTRQIGAQKTFRYQPLLLDVANITGGRIAIYTNSALVETGDPSDVEIQVHPATRETAVIGRQGRMTLHRRSTESPVKGKGLIDNWEGVLFSLHADEGTVLIDVQDLTCRIVSNVPLEGVQTLIGDRETMVRMNHLAENSKSVVFHPDDIFTLLETDDSATFGIPADQRLSITFTGVVNTIFEFGNSSFDQNKPDIHTQEQIPSQPASQAPEGYSPPEAPKSDPGSPILP